MGGEDMKTVHAGAGRIDAEIRDVVREMTLMASAALRTRGIILSDEEGTELQQAINEHVQGSIEIRAAVINLVERGDGPEAA